MRFEGGREPVTVGHLLASRAQGQGGDPALIGDGAPPLSYGGLWDLAAETRRVLRAAGAGASDRVAIVLPDGPVMAAAFLATAAAASAAPLNPAYREAEFDFFLSDLGARVLLLPEGVGGPAPEAASRRGIPILRVAADPGGPAGSFRLRPEGGSARIGEAPAGEPGTDGEALVLHTSGTTSRPKMVPLTHSNLLASAGSIARSLALGPRDRCLCVMPLFHIHGLVGALLSTLVSGGSVVCTPGFRAPEFLRWIGEFVPTWYTAVPTMHQAIVERAALEGFVPGRSSLRFARSSSAPLPTVLQGRLEEALGVPLLQAYGMTEASHQVAVNPLPPGERKPGSVGLPTGTEVSILGVDGLPLGPETVGEVALRGPGVTKGYAANPEANATAFAGGWFRTGDQGYRDGEGYVFLTGRLKELINRGGEKIAPLEVDEALGGHPAVAQVLSFALPHPRLGEVVGAAVVLRPGASVGERQLQEFAATRLASFKVPARIRFVDALPRGPTGKLQRIGLAARLGVEADPEEGGAGPSAFVAPATETERLLAEHLRGILRVDRVGTADRFEELGLDSLTALRVADWIRSTFPCDFTVRDLFGRGTVGSVAAYLDSGGRP